MMDPPLGRIHHDLDPSALTTASILREISSLKELMFARFEAITTRMDANDKAVDVFSANLVRVPTDVDKQVGNLRSYHDEKITALRIEILEHFKAVEQQFKGIADQFALNDKAVAAAFSAAKDAVGENTKWFKETSDKSEKSAADQIRQQSSLLSSNYQALRDLISAIDTRVTRIEGLGLGTAAAQSSQRDERTDHRSSNNWTLAVVLGAISVVGLVSNIIFDLLRK